MAKTCGCDTETCGCCEGTRKLTPVTVDNRPGLPAIQYRVGTHNSFFESMQARLSTMTVDAPGADNQTVETFRPLTGLTTRETSDPAMALLDGWATVGHVLTFYQERIANEGYLRTATERRSVLELSRLVGYEPRPGVAATVYLAYTLDNSQTEPVEVPVGTQSQSVPLSGSGDLPQTFETAEKLITRSEWNNLQVRQKLPQNITLANAVSVDTISVAGSNTNLKAGDTLLLVFGAKGTPSVARTVSSVDAVAAENRTDIHLQTDADLGAAAPLLAAMVLALAPTVNPNTISAGARLLYRSGILLGGAYLGPSVAPSSWIQQLEYAVENPADETGGGPPLTTGQQALFDDFKSKLNTALGGTPSDGQAPELRTAVTQLAKPKVPQVANTLQLTRTLAVSFAQGTDAPKQLLANFVPEIKQTLYQAVSSLGVSTTTPELQGVYAIRTSAPLFGAAAVDRTAYKKDSQDPTLLTPQSIPWTVDQGEATNAMFLDQAYPAILSKSYVMVQTVSGKDIVRRVFQVTDSTTGQRSAYGLSGKSTRLSLSSDWWYGIQDSFSTVRSTFVYGQTEKLELVDAPVTEDVAGQEIDLAGLYKELTSGRWVIFSGERTDVPGVTGVQGTELLMISGLRHGFNDATPLPGEEIHTTLLLATKTAYSYKRDSLTIYGNVVKATHGETRAETMGSGDGSQALQQFALRQPPLTYVSAPTPSGVNSTLAVYVNDIQWHETDTLAGLGPKDRNFITETDDDAVTTVIFGNGREGSRLPTGVENVKAIYRNGIGKPGNVLAQQISQMKTRPLGARAVINPLAASGGADKESRDQARENAPLAVMSLDRLVSVRDYADFTRTFAGIAKADARVLSNGRQQLVHLTIAGADDIPIDVNSDLYRNLLATLRKYGDPNTPVQVDLRELIILVLSAKIKLDPDYLWEPVATAIRASLLDLFGFDKRSLGQWALLCEIISAIQNIPGVVYVDVDAFGGVPQTRVVPPGRDPNGNPTPARTELLLPDDIAAAIRKLTGGGQVLKSAARDEFPRPKPKPPVIAGRLTSTGPAQGVEAAVAHYEFGLLRPAQLAIFSDSVPDTIILNQII